MAAVAVVCAWMEAAAANNAVGEGHLQGGGRWQARVTRAWPCLPARRAAPPAGQQTPRPGLTFVLLGASSPPGDHASQQRRLSDTQTPTRSTCLTPSAVRAVARVRMQRISLHIRGGGRAEGRTARRRHGGSKKETWAELPTHSVRQAHRSALDGRAATHEGPPPPPGGRGGVNRKGCALSGQHPGRLPRSRPSTGWGR